MRMIFICCMCKVDMPDIAENTTVHKCAVKNISICKYFCGVKYLDSVLCSYPHGNKDE